MLSGTYCLWRTSSTNALRIICHLSSNSIFIKSKSWLTMIGKRKNSSTDTLPQELHKYNQNFFSLCKLVKVAILWIKSCLHHPKSFLFSVRNISTEIDNIWANLFLLAIFYFLVTHKDDKDHTTSLIISL